MERDGTVVRAWLGLGLGLARGVGLRGEGLGLGVRARASAAVRASGRLEPDAERAREGLVLLASVQQQVRRAARETLHPRNGAALCQQPLCAHGQAGRQRDARGRLDLREIYGRYTGDVGEM